MVEHQFRIAEIEIEKSPTDEKIVGLFRYENGTSKKKGNTVLILAEIASTLYAYERLLDIINESAEQARLLVAGVEQDPVARFEKLIERINNDVATFLAGEPTPLSWGRVNIFILELSPNHICLTGRGRLMNVFFQKQEDGSYRTFDLFGSLEQPLDVDPQKAFPSLICGDVKAGDILIAGTTNLERLRQELRVKERLTTLPPVSAAMEIKQDLERRGIPDDFMAAVVACCAIEMPTGIAAKLQTFQEEESKSTASINKLREAEMETAQNLSPAIRPMKNGAETPKPGARPANTLSRKALGGVLGLLKKAQERFTSSRSGKRDVAMMASLRGMSAGHGSAFGPSQKRLAIIIAAVLLVVVVGVGFVKRNQRIAAEEAAWTTAYEQAVDNRNRAESDLVYANDGRARKEIETAEKLLAGLDVSKPEHKEKADALRASLTDLRERLRKLVTAEPVTELVALSGAADGALAAPVLVNTTAYAVDNSTREILKVDLSTKEVKRFKLPDEAEDIIAGSAGQRSVVFTTAKGLLYSINTTSDAVSAVSSVRRASSTADVIIYANRAYSLDGEAGQVWRAASSGSGFGSQAGYIQAANIDLKGAVSLAIDSNVYILKSDGTIARFLSGGQEGFTLSPVDPPLRAASAVWTNSDATRIAITDPADKRILVFTKDGALKAQIVSDQFAALRDIDGNEAAKQLLVVSGTRLLLVPLP